RIKNLSSDKLLPAILFRCSLRESVEYVARQTSRTPTTEILCVDASEVFAWVQGGVAAMHAFSFNLLRRATNASVAQHVKELADAASLANLERLILRHLLFENRSGYFLLDSHANEIAFLFSAAANRGRALLNQARQLSPDLLRLSTDQLE